MKVPVSFVTMIVCIAAFSSNVSAQGQHPTPAVSSVPAATQPDASTTKITNARVVQMTKMGLDDDVIVARIKHGVCDFQLTDNDLMELKKEGVSSKVVAAMMDSVPAASATSEPDDGKVRVFVTDSESWEMRGGGGGGGNSNGWGASSSFSGGARPQTAEIIKTLNERCPQFTVTNVLGKANFVIVLDHEGGKGVLRHQTNRRFRPQWRRHL